MSHKKVAVLIDGGYFTKIFKKQKKHYPSATEVISFAKKIIDPKKNEEIFRIYYYDAPYYEGTITNPISNIAEDYKKSKKYAAVSSFQSDLAKKDLIAFRKGSLGFRGWVLSESGLEKVNKVKATSKQQQVQAGAVMLTANHLKNIELHEYDVVPNFEQKAVDIKIGLDIAWLSSKRIVDALALVTGDTDFIPAMKAARREGLLILLIELDKLKGSLKEHSDEIRPVSF